MKRVFVLLVILFFSTYSHGDAQVNTEVCRVGNDSLGFSVRSGLDFTIMVGNSDFQYLGTNTRFNYNWGDHYTFLITNGGFGQSNGKSYFGQALAHLRNVNSIRNDIQLEEFVQYDNDKKRLLLHRVLAGGGFRFKVINTSKVEARMATSIFYEQEKYDLPKTAIHKTDVAAFRSSSYFTFSIALKEYVSVLSTTYFQPDITDIDDVKILSDNALKVKLAENIGFTTKINVRYDSRPADGIKEFDLITKVGIVLNFK